MSEETFIVLDVSYLCWRAFHTTGELEHEGVRTGVLYGVFRDILSFQDLFATEKIIFCFDSRVSKRKAIYPGYKGTRSDSYKEMSEEEIIAHQEVRKQIEMLEIKYLPKIGFANTWSEEGYEADDQIAMACEVIAEQHDHAVIVGTDGDLLQLLSPSTIIWNPAKKKTITIDSFRSEWGIEPSQWADAKAIAGCGTDDVTGVKGVGEKTAVKFLTGKLKPTTKAFASIIQSTDLWKSNLPIVRLPFEGIQKKKIRPDEVTQQRWSWVMEKLGMSSMRELHRGR